jgi:hypothetical protein
MISSNSLQDAWQAADVTVQFDRALEGNISDLQDARYATLEPIATRSPPRRLISVTLQTQLNTQNKSVAQNKVAATATLAQTKNSEVELSKSSSPRRRRSSRASRPSPRARAARAYSPIRPSATAGAATTISATASGGICR